MNALNVFAAFIQAFAAVAVAALTVALVKATKQYVDSTHAIAQASKEATELTRQTFQATHRPFIAVDVSFSLTMSMQFTCSCELRNNGNDEALELSIEFCSEGDSHPTVLRFGDLQPQQGRTIVSNFSVSPGLARQWLELAKTRQAIPLTYTRTFSTRDGRQWSQKGTVVYDPTEEIMTRLFAVAKQPATAAPK
jgi:hypothetical protein